MILPEQLYPHIPKKIAHWNTQDVLLWFQLNRIPINISSNNQQQQQHTLNGITLMRANPQFLQKQCGIQSKIVVKRVLQWLEQDLIDFQQYIDEQQTNLPTCQNIPLEPQITFKPQPSSLFQILQLAAISHKIPPSPINDQNQPADMNCQPTPQIFLDKANRHLNAIRPLENVKKWNKKRPSQDEFTVVHKMQDKNIKHQQPSKQQQLRVSNGIRGASFVQSNYQVCQNMLKFVYECNGQTLDVQLCNQGKIGRSAKNQILIAQQSVSRQHARVIKQDDKFFIKDVGSTYGTHIQIKNSQQIQQGDILSIGAVQLQLIQLKVSKNKSSFNLKYLKLNDQSKQTFSLYYKKQYSIGKKDKDIIISGKGVSSNHARFILTQGKVVLVPQKGLTFTKMRKQQLYALEHEEVKVRFGMQPVTIYLKHNLKPIINISQFQPQRISNKKY